MKKLLILGLILITGLFLFTGCMELEEDEVANAEREYTEKVQMEAQRQVGQPLIDDYFEKKMFKRIYELRDNSELVTYVYTRNLEGKYIYEGKAIGYGLPYSVQYNSPNKVVDAEDYLGHSLYETPVAVVDQAEPNGMYMPEGLAATWLIMINEETGETEPAYFEPEIVVTQSKKPRRLIAEWSLPDNY
jgi:hypothetical protein